MGVNKISLGTRTLLDVSGVEAQQSNVLANVSYVNSDGELVVGTMPNNGAISETISTKAGTVTVPQGYHDGNGKVGISSTEQSKIIASNIKSGIKILGVNGSYKGDLIQISGSVSLASDTSLNMVISNSAIKSTSTIVMGQLSGSVSTSLDMAYVDLTGNTAGRAWCASNPGTLSLWNMASVKATVSSGKITIAPTGSYGFAKNTSYSYVIIIKP